MRAQIYLSLTALLTAAAQLPSLDKGGLERLNPARVLIDQRKPLALAEPARARLDTVRRQLDLRNGDRMRTGDSLQRLIRQATASGRGVTRGDSVKWAKMNKEVERGQAAKRDYVALLLAIKDDVDSTTVRALAILTDAQRPRGESLVERSNRQLTALLARANSGTRVR